MVVPRGDAGGGGDDDDDYDAGVSCVAFHPSIGEEAGDGDDGDGGDGGGGGTASSTIHRGECAAYVSSGNRVYGYDLRRHVDVASTTTTTTTTSTPMIIRTPHYDLTDDFGCADEINELSFSYPRRGGRKAYLLSAADDSGDVRVVEDPRFRGGRRESRTATTAAALRHADTGTSAIATCATFRPKSHDGGGGGRANDAHSYLATAGTDCAVRLWDAGDVRRSRRPTSIATIGPRHVDDPSSSSSSIRLCNPPYVHSLSWSPSGRLLAAGVGDGSVTVYRAEGHRLVGVGRFGDEVGGHASAVAAVRFVDFAPSAAATDRRRGRTEVGDRLLISAGNDGNLIFWDLGPDVAGRGPSDPRSYLGCPASPEIETSLEGDGRHGAATSSSPGVLFKIEHRHKPNWIACGGANDVALPRLVFVADTTNDISVYTLPM
jgi:WD40 repeat protein